MEHQHALKLEFQVAEKYIFLKYYQVLYENQNKW